MELYQDLKDEVNKKINEILETGRNHRKLLKAYKNYLGRIKDRVIIDKFDEILNGDKLFNEKEDNWLELMTVREETPALFGEMVKEKQLKPAYYLLHRMYHLKELGQVSKGDYKNLVKSFIELAKEVLPSGEERSALTFNVDKGTFDYNL